MKKMVIFCEGVVCGEKLPSYEFIIKSMLSMAPNALKSDIKVVAGDCLITENLIVGLGMQEHTKLINDQYHIKEAVWPKYFGPVWHQVISHELSNMMEARDEETFNINLNSAKQKVQNKPNHVKYLDSYRNKRHLYSSYIINSYPGGLMRLGSTLSEQNHASFVARIGSGFDDNICKSFQKWL